MATSTRTKADLRRGAFMGAPVGYALGLAVYAGIGYWAAGAAGAIAGVLIATAFAAVGLRLLLGYIDAVGE